MVKKVEFINIYIYDNLNFDFNIDNINMKRHILICLFIHVGG